MSAILESIPLNWVKPAVRSDEMKQQLETASKYEFLGGIHHLHSKKWLYDPKVIGYASTFFIELPPQATYWYTALQRLNILPEYVPALPENFMEVYFGNCPIKDMEGRLKEDNISYKLYETRSLYLIPTMSLNDLEEKADSYGSYAYGVLQHRSNPLKFQMNYPRREPEINRVMSVTSDVWEWVLIPNEALEESRDMGFSMQRELLYTLNQRVLEGPKYEVGTLKQIAAFLIFHKVATGKTLYEAAHAQNGHRGSMVRVKEITSQYDYRWKIGYFDIFGVWISPGSDHFQRMEEGIAAVRKFASSPFIRHRQEDYSEIPDSKKKKLY